MLLRMASRIFARAVARRPHAFDDGDVASVVATFDQLQREAWRRGPWLLLRCWWREYHSLRALDSMSASQKGQSLSLGADLRQAVRALVRVPGFTLTVVLTLALGIGANTAIFSVVDAVLLKPLPYPEPDRLVAVAELPPTGVRNTVSPASFLTWQETARSFTGLAARQSISTTILGEAVPEELRAARVSANYFDVLGVPAAHGRTFVAADGRPGAPCVTVVADRLWARLWSRDPAVIGRPIRFSQGTCQIIGVLAPDSVFDRVPFQLYQPLTFTLATAPRGHFLTVIGRIAPGVNLAQAQEEMRSVAGTFSQTIPTKQGWTAAVDPWRDTIVRPDTRRLVLVIFGAVGMVLLVAMVNVASLGLSRAASRRREVSIRLALGAGAGRLFSYFMAESLVVSALGGVIGVLIGFWCLSAFTALMPPGTLPTEAVVSLDLRVLAFTAGLVLLVTLGVGAVPAWQGTRSTAGDALRREGRGSTASAGSRRIQSGLLVAQIALAMVLVTGAVWLGTSFARLSQVDPGFNPSSVITFRLSVPGTTAEEIRRTHAGIVEEVGRLPGVQALGASTSLPLRGWRFGTSIRVDGIPPTDPARMNSHIQHTAGDYFRALEIPFVEGRPFEAVEHSSTARVAIVNQTFVRRYIGDGPAVGRRLRLGVSADSDGANTESWEIVGVVRDLKTGGLADAELQTPEVYVPHAAAPAPDLSYAVRAADGAVSLEQLRDAVRRVNPDLPLGAVMTMESLVGNSLVTQRFRTSLVAGFALVALLVAVTGVYAVRSQAVAARRRELGIRLALGATRGQVMRLVIGQGAQLVIAGILIGLAGAWSSGAAIDQWLFAVDRQILGRSPWHYSPLVLRASSQAGCLRARPPGWSRSKPSGTSSQEPLTDIVTTNTIDM